MKRFTVCVFFTVVASGVAMGVFAPAAAAAPPVRSEVTISDTGVAEDGCIFPVTVSASGSATETDFFDKNGALNRIQLHVTERDTYSANGKSLQGSSFTYDISLLLDGAGNLVAASA